MHFEHLTKEVYANMTVNNVRQLVKSHVENNTYFPEKYLVHEINLYSRI